ncbi:hypothetical protein B0T26DRAFT_780384 [Lasiosphaeria miniovina]|uniref:Zn(2)-C6 fungal-type domain-containing protein n=1 Tax=Lasiosphaeria miniovina TaxID=1954250 RepID=A0AA40AB91_9PEZI|nr:uncharacterized protein B0T26DRAFT_780384 [Lasiosphaeria miniovina]KAK0712740.1 hypothetical protein B0T26DRAFT_780384 [Lasiosphaeria miniovina]
MLRRSHTKSRKGCAQCKQRHVKVIINAPLKCDEGRPLCRLCTLSQRECSFETEAAGPEYLSVSGASSHEPSISPGGGSSPDGLADAAQATLGEALNLDHMELLIHAVCNNKDMFNLGDGSGGHTNADLANLHLSLHAGLDAPYLLHAMLAFSARHLAFLHPERAPTYLHRAVALQTRAVSLCNASWAGSGSAAVDESNCVPVLLFATVLGHHVLADTVSSRLDGFVAHYARCVDVHRGIYAVALAAWPLLLRSGLGAALAWSSGFTSRPPRGRHTARATELVDAAADLSDAEKAACRAAIQYLQVGFDAMLAGEDANGSDGDDEQGAEERQRARYQMLFLWTMLVPHEFTGLLLAKQPEALVVLAYYALLLHYGRAMWQVGGAGAAIVAMVAEFLGPDWEYWLAYPCEMVAACG